MFTINEIYDARRFGSLRIAAYALVRRSITLISQGTEVDVERKLANTRRKKNENNEGEQARNVSEEAMLLDTL